MKRALLFISLLVVVAGCSNSTGPAGTVIQVRLRDDAARPAGPNRVYVTLPSGERMEARTGMDGTTVFRVNGGGEYHVRVLPRAGYVSTPELSRSVSVDELGKAVVDFVLYREWGGDGPPEHYGWL